MDSAAITEDRKRIDPKVAPPLSWRVVVSCTHIQYDAPMPEDPLAYMTLGQAWPQLIYVAECAPCHQRRRIDLRAMAVRLGADFPLRDLRMRLRCSACGSRQVTIATLWKNASGSET